MYSELQKESHGSGELVIFHDFSAVVQRAQAPVDLCLGRHLRAK